MKRLTKRQAQVLDRINALIPYKQIAYEFGISEVTVVGHARKIRQNLGLTGESQSLKTLLRAPSGELVIPSPS